MLKNVASKQIQKVAMFSSDPKRGFLIMKTTFSYFPGMFENPAPAKYYLKKQNQKYYEILSICECVGEKSITLFVISE